MRPLCTETSDFLAHRLGPSSPPPGRIDERPVIELRAHPDLVKHAAGYCIKEISALSERGESVYEDPITATQDDLVIEGYALWRLAKLQKRKTIRCIVREMGKEQALIHIIGRNLGSKGINNFVRILLALELETWFQEQAKRNQRMGGAEQGFVTIDGS